jgi:phosphoglycerol transferase MdoB-like AlkP superfamily enzyme
MQARLLRTFKIFVSVFIILSVALAIVDIGYLKEYNDRFNFWIFNFFFDDQRAILATIQKTYNLPLVAATGLAISGCLVFFYLKFMRRFSVLRYGSFQSFLGHSILMLVFFVAAARGSVSRRPLQQIDAAITGNEFLNKCVPNSYYALYFAWKEFGTQSNVALARQSCSPENVERAFEILGANTRDIDELILRVSKGAKLSKKPRHIFLIVMESQDNWPFLEENSDLNLCPNLKQLGEKGLYFKNFIPTGHGTLSAVAVQMCNYPNMEFFINYAENGLKSCDFSVGKSFQRLGYHTNFYYAGYLSWQRIDRFAAVHGYQSSYGGDVMESYAGNEWGVEDKELFNFIIKTLRSDIDSFNLILTASNHPPFSVDLRSENVPLEHLGRFATNEKRTKHLGHAWYADRCVGDFVREIEKKTDAALFIITGDHFSRKHYKSDFSLFDECTVPLIIYGKDFNDDLKQYQPHTGSQTDIICTIVEMIAPKGMTYRSFGKDLLSSDGIHEGYSTYATITDNCIAMNDGTRCERIPESGTQQNQTENLDIKLSITRNLAWRMLAKHRFFKCIEGKQIE